MNKTQSSAVLLAVAAALIFLPPSYLTLPSGGRELASVTSGKTPADWVNLQFPGGLVFRGATSPFGMMMWGPYKSGYSLTALSGAEMWDYYSNDVPILPSLIPPEVMVRGSVVRPPSQDSGEPGHYRAVQKDGVEVDLVTTPRTGLGSFKFPTQKARFFYITLPGSIKADSPQQLSGFSRRQSRTVYFVYQFDRPFKRFDTWSARRKKSDPVEGGYVSFDPGDDSIQVKVGMSYVSTANALLNLKTENPNSDLGLAMSAAKSRWNDALSRIQIQGGQDSERQLFYTMLYFSLLQPNTFSDVNGDYQGFDQQTHNDTQHVHYANYSGWDIYRSEIPLLALLFPKETSDMMQTLVDASVSCGAMPRWPVDEFETGVMESGSATPIVAQAIAFGARKFDIAGAFSAIDKVESKPGVSCQGTEERWRLKDYLSLGYQPVDMKEYLGQQTAASTLDYAIGDFSASRVALYLGEPKKADQYLALSQNWKNIFNPTSGYIQPKNRDGSWWKSFDPQHGHLLGFTEGNAIQYSWIVPQNIAGLFAQMGGADKVIPRLDHFFQKLNENEDSAYAWIGNEPSFGTPWMYDWAGAPWKTQQVVRRMITEVFMNGQPGANDLGAMSSWAVWAMIGLYPEIPGVGGFALASPLFPKTIISLDSGKTVTLSAIRASADMPYVQSLRINGTDWHSSWIPLEQILGASTELVFDLDKTPNSSWGSGVSDLPPSFAPN